MPSEQQREQIERRFLYRCKECGAMYDDGGSMWRHITKHAAWINWPWKDTSTPFTERYEMIEVEGWDVIKK